MDFLIVITATGVFIVLLLVVMQRIEEALNQHRDEAHGEPE